MARFSMRLKMLREKQHKSRKVLSELCGLPSDAVRRYESEEVDINRIEVRSVVAIADYFGVSVDYVLGRTDKP